MGSKFVAISDPVHALLRAITRTLPLQIRTRSDGLPVLEHDLAGIELPEDYYLLAAFHGLRGLPLEGLGCRRAQLTGVNLRTLAARAGYFDVTRLDRRCVRDLRLTSAIDRPGLVAGELLVFGAGMLRACNDDLQEPAHRYLWARYGRIQSRQEIVLARLHALHPSVTPRRAGKETYESTNVIYGDALGQLEQLWERRADTDFLDDVAASLQAIRLHSTVHATFYPPHNVPGLMHLHLRAQCRWNRAPADARGLLRRLEHILENTEVDSAPLTLCQRTEVIHSPAAEDDSLEDPDDRRSGYDGWLADDGNLQAG